MDGRPSTPGIVILVLITFLVAGGIAAGTDNSGSPGGSSSSRAGAEEAAALVGPIAQRVERIRGLRFDSLPKPLIVTPAQTRRDQLAELDREGNPDEREAATQVLVLLGLLEPDADLREISADVSSEQVAGYYDTRRKRLAVVAGPGGGSRVIAEITLAHELDHALDDQAIGIDEVTAAGADDAGSAYTALVEGIATSVMTDYARRFIKPGDGLRSALGSLGGTSGAGSIPPYIQASLLFSYVSGQQFVERLRSVGHGWKLVNYALRSRPPASTEQVIHPTKYLVNERPVRVRLGVRRLLGDGWKRAAFGTIGEFDTHQLLMLGVGDVRAGNAAAGWGGGRYELWRGPGDCESPCRSGAAVVVSWAWDTEADARESVSALRPYVTRGLSGRPADGPDAWSVGDGAAAISTSGRDVTLALAPSVAVARRLASGARR